MSCNDTTDESSVAGKESIIVPILFGIIFIVGFLGNFIVISVRIKRRDYFVFFVKK